MTITPYFQSWTQVDRLSGTIAPGRTQDVTVTIDGTYLEAGTFDTSFTIISNDANEAEIEFPISIEVFDE